MPKQAKSSKSTSASEVVVNVVDPKIIDMKPEAKPKSASDMLAGLAGKSKTQKKATATKERIVLKLSEHAQDLYRRFAPVKQLLDVVVSEEEAVKSELNGELLKSYLDLMWDTKTQPANPAIQVCDATGKVDCEGMFIVTERIKVQIPNEEDPAGSVKQLLVDMGVDQSKAEALVDNEVEFEPVLMLRPFRELIEGHYGQDRQFIEASPAEKLVGEKILKLITENLDDDEKEMVLIRTPKTLVKKGFLQRVASYANAREQLSAIFKVFSTVNQNKGAKFAVSDTPVQKTNRLLAFAKELLGDSSAKDKDED